ncbi:sialin-like [Chironomus tepperi]|uniref:sialin-like n=1 Tax=Chironomus tepperi TaxID=113505 RepID=UPI00391F4E0D
MTEEREIIKDDGTKETVQDFNWSPADKGVALASYFYGYVTTQALGGILATKYGGFMIFNIGIFVTGIFAMLTPMVCPLGIGFLLANRVIIGIFSGLSFTSAYDVLSRWIPPSERSRSVSFVMAGINIGNFTANFASGYISVHFGWRWIFYVFGIVAIIWSILWLLLARKSPEDDKWITQAEKEYIMESLKEENSQEKLATPWKAIAKSVPCYAIFAADAAFSWGFFTLVTQLPQYMDEVLKFSLQNSATISSFPYLLYPFIAMSAGSLADWFLKRKILTVTQVRKYFNSFALLCQMLFLFIVAFVSDRTTIVVCIILSVGAGAIAASGYLANPLDIASQFSSIIYGISSTFSVLTGVISPTITGFIVTSPEPGLYRIVFLIACTIYLIGTIIYACFASGEIQPWAVAPEPVKDVEVKK